MGDRPPSVDESEPAQPRQQPARATRSVWLSWRPLLALGVAALSAWLLWPLVQRLRPQSHLTLRHQGELPELADAPPVRTGPRASAEELDAPRPPSVESAYRLIAAEHARQLFPIDPGFGELDFFAGFRHASNLDHRRGFKEHPDGFWMLRTNSLGLREDRELVLTPPDLRILVTGDSHTDGVCNNDESFAHLLERDLRKHRPGHTVEVINAGKGGYTFYNYAGVLERFLALKPDVFVVGLYGGNDFEEALTLHYYLSEGQRPSGARNYAEELTRAERIHRHALPQGILSYKYFAWNPDQIDVALVAARDMTEHVLAVCTERGIRPLYVYIPPVFDVTPDEPLMRLALLREALGLEDADLRSSDEMADRFLAWLEERGVETLDMRPIYRASQERLYWVRDVHINVAGHERIAAALLERLAE